MAMATNSRFQEDPSQYLKDKLMDAIFRKIWSTVVAKNLQTLIDAAWSNEGQGIKYRMLLVNLKLNICACM